MIIWGMSGKGHDASVTVWGPNKITGLPTLLYENYTRNKRHNKSEIKKLLRYGKPDRIVWYEKPFKKALRMLYAGQEKPFKRNRIKSYLKDLCDFPLPKCVYINHHEAHAAHFYDSPFKEALIFVIDSIGEWDCTSVWKGKSYSGHLVKLDSVSYPDSLGLWYSSMTKAAGLKPNSDEGTFESLYDESQLDEFALRAVEKYIMPHEWRPMFWKNLHRGVGDSLPGPKKFTPIEIATATQFVFSQKVTKMITHWCEKEQINNVVLAGGCAFNKSVRKDITDLGFNLWVPNNPGDGGSAKSCVNAYLRKKALVDISLNQRPFHS
jgi:predicted NodU family carbamoyl transferase